MSSIAFSQMGREARFPAVAALMKAALDNPDLLSLAVGFTDNATLPSTEFAAAACALAARPGEPEYLQYGSTQGRPGLRAQLAERLRHWEPELGADDLERRLMITNGSQQALYLAVQALCDRGDIVLVDRPTYFVFLDVLAGLGARAVTLPFASDGRLELTELDALLRRLRETGEARRVKAVYLVSYFSNPSGRSMSEGDKAALGRALAARGLVVPLLEDAAYRELFFAEPHPARSALTLPEWREFPQLYLATLTKPFSTGAKVGYAYCTDERWLHQMLAIKGTHDFGTANYAQALFEEVLGAGAFETHLPKVRAGYHAKMHVLHDEFVAAGLRELGWTWDEPAGGLYLWLRAPAHVDTGMDAAFCRACVEAGVLYVPGDLFFGDQPEKNWVRASFGVLAPEQLREAARRFVTVARRFPA